MYEEFYGLSRLPFQLLPDPDFFYRSQKHDKALTCLDYGVFERAGFIVITGEIGTGKTTLLRYMLRSLSGDLPIALLNQTFLPPEDFLRALCQEFSLPYEAKGKSELIELFGTFIVNQYQQGRYVILILDEAQNLPLDTLEEIRMLSNLDADNERLLQIILVGQPHLRSKLQREELRQLLQRVEVSYHLEPLDREEIQEYIKFRLETAGAEDPDLFDESTIDVLFDCTAGVPRLINLICHRCLVYGFADSQKKISRDLLEKMLEDRKAEGVYPQANIESSIQNDEVIDKPTENKENSEAFISQNQLTATLNRLTEISGASMRAVELAAAKAANMTSDGHLAFVKEQLAEERELREALEHRLGRAEDDLVRMRNTLSQKIHEDPNRNSADTESSLISQRPLNPLRDIRSFFSAKASRRTILLLIFIIAIISFTSLALWRSKGPKIIEQQPERESKALKYDVPPSPPPPKAEPNDKKLSQAQLQKPLPADENAVVQISDIAPAPSVDQNSKTSATQESKQSLASPVATIPKKVTAGGSGGTKEIEPKIYVCVVKMANVRARPDIKAPMLGRIARGTEVEVIGKQGNWMQLRFKGGESAWIYSSLLRRRD